ncbi:MAG: hypothetical protein MRERV_65c007 [Mycoplasmataceae bacterium RV_VA103A]|nr:MAG: hypothetical protein MRERV_65c007 [Mycoplasmataceae bacterium RV_VA103A]
MLYSSMTRIVFRPEEVRKINFWMADQPGGSIG